MSEVTRDWDAERLERHPKPSTFRISGEVFEIRQGVSPEEFGEIASPYYAMTSATSMQDAATIADDLIAGFLANETDGERWREVRAQRNPAVTAREIREIISWIMEEQTGIPTTQPEPSQNGDGAAGENSTESSSSAQEESEASVA